MINTERLELVPFDEKYASDLYEIWSNFEVIKYTYMPLMTSIDECVTMIHQQINRTDREFTDRFIILLDNKAIGMVGCAVMNKEKLFFSLYYQLSQTYWGRGYASEATNAILKYVFDKYPNAIIKADAVSINPSSLAVLSQRPRRKQRSIKLVAQRAVGYLTLAAVAKGGPSLTLARCSRE